MSEPLWRPSPARIASARVTAFIEKVNRAHNAGADGMPALWRWSVDSPELFWKDVWEFGQVIGDGPGAVTVDDVHKLPGATWFPEARLNYAENLLRRRDDGDALVFWGEDKTKRRLTHRQLYDLVSLLAQAMQAAGVQKGDRVAGLVSNMPEAIAGALAAACFGAIWCSASPDFGVQGVLDRFGQIAPKLLIAVDGYWYGGKAFDIRDKVDAIATRIESLTRVVMIPYLNPNANIGVIPKAVWLDHFLAPFVPGDIPFTRLPFDHPLYILFTSGTTGVPKCIVHGAGGTLLQHIKELALHSDVHEGDRLFYFTTCGWMMWNWLVSGLAVGATLLLYDGSPAVHDNRIVFDYADAERMTHLGTSAKWIDSIAKAGLDPISTHKLTELRGVLSTGSVLAPEGFDYVYEHVKTDVCLSSISGGTDIVSCFMLGNPAGPVWRGELQSRGLGMKVEVFDDNGKPVQGEKGELVCTQSFPSCPVGFWNDPGDARFKAAYFEQHPGVWTHGDWVMLTEHDGIVVYGRSDAVLNPGGVRIGTAEIYRQVERIHEVLEALVIAQDWEGDVRVVLFVRLREGVVLDEALQDRIRKTIRANASPRHVPARIIQVADIPRTRSGKITELAVRDVVHGRAVKNQEALANPEALKLFENLPELAV